MSLAIGLFWSLLLNMSLVGLFRKRFEETLPMAYILGGLCLYAFGLFGHISTGYLFSWVLIAVLLLIFILQCFKDRKRLKTFLDDFVTPGLLVFLILFVYVFFLQRYRGFSITDEFWNWGLQVREDFRYDSFLSEESLYQDRTYPPFLTILELLFCYFGGEFAEGYCFRAVTTFCLILYLPLLKDLKWKRPADLGKAFLAMAVFILLGLCISITPTDGDTPHIYNTIYVDFPMALFAAYSFYQLYTCEKWTVFSVLNAILSLSVLLLLKQTGIAFAALVFLFLLFLVFRKGERKQKRSLLIPVLIVAVPVLIYGSWSVYALLMGQPTGMASLLGMEKIRAFLGYLFDPSNEMNAVVREYFGICLTRPLVLHPLPFTYATYTLFACVSLFLILFFLYRDRGASIVLPGIYLFGSAAYSVARIYLFLSIYTDFQGRNFVSFDRYMKTYLYIGTVLNVLLLLGYFLKEKNGKKSYIGIIATLVLTLLLVEPQNYNELKPLREYTGIQNATMTVITDMVESTKEGSRFLFIEQYSVEQGWRAVLDYIFKGGPYTVDTIVLGPESYSGQYALDISVEEYLELLQNYDYLYLLYPDEVYIQKYWEPTTDADMINQRLYSIVDVSDGYAELSEVGDYPLPVQ